MELVNQNGAVFVWIGVQIDAGPRFVVVSMTNVSFAVEGTSNVKSPPECAMELRRG